ncbi:TPA: 4-hydroxy-tetrahydrodipicolinate synthase [Candidatus Poribacteria bacterium]|nr:4-hydroxy-tetrahydrodipicolinate synthase [Candidatus Poribacteria bacterium]
MTFKPHGIIPALVTPLKDDESIDEKGLRAVVNHVIEGGVHGVFAVGSQGEFYALSKEEKRQVLKIVIDEVDGRVPVYAGTGALTTKEVIDLTKMAADMGAAAASVLTPFFIVPSQDELIRHYEAVANAVDLPILLYGNPMRTRVDLETATVVKLAQVDNIIGIKDSSGNLALTADYIDNAPEDFAVIAGNDALIYAILLMGGKGAIAATSNAVPKLVVSIYENIQSGDLKAARAAQAALAPLRKAFTLSTFPVVVKEAMEVIGVCGGRAKHPVGRMPQEARKKLEEIIETLREYL